jgi:methyl-accepting chemotaxis protein
VHAALLACIVNYRASKMNIGNIKIGHRLWLGFSIVILLLVAIATIAVGRINHINTMVDSIQKDPYVKVVMINEIQDHQTNLARFLIKRVTNLMSEISAASSEQAAGVSQFGEAVTQMDQVTQQNAALVEEMAAAAASLKSQAGELVQTEAIFKLGAG